jgi:NAD-dependent oxidoreductase involved in siderophore biosynthesis
LPDSLQVRKNQAPVHGRELGNLREVTNQLLFMGWINSFFLEFPAERAWLKSASFISCFSSQTF